jgi:TetR/AcrR family tetracycline transcriptional repressor
MVRSRRSKNPSPNATKRKSRDLSRDKLIVAALKLIDERGAAAVTMRALADAVGVTPMALYNHFSSKRDLLAAVADHVISTAEFDGKRTDWRDQVRHCFDVIRSLCLRHPGLPSLLEQDGAAPASVFAPMEVTLRALKEAGLDELNSLRTYFLLISFTLGQVSYQTRGPIAGLETPEKIRAERIVRRGYTVAKHSELRPSWDFDSSFAFGISLIENGVEATVARRRRARISKRHR